MTAPSEPAYGEHGEWDALAVGWALSALDPHDEARFAVHLPTCARCTETVSESLRSVADLAYAVPDEPPPAGLKQRILLAAAAEPRAGAPAPRTGAAAGGGSWPNSTAGPEQWSGAPEQRPVDEARFAPPGEEHAGPTGRLRLPEPRPEDLRRPPGDAVPPGPRVPGDLPRTGPAGRGRHAAPDADEPLGPVPPAASPAQPSNVVPLQPRRRRWASVVAAAAAVVLIAALGAWNLRLRSEQDDLRQIVAQREAAISQLTADGPAQVAAVQAVDKNLKLLPTRRATIVVVNGRVQVITETLKQTTGSQTYWLWTLDCVDKIGNLKPVTGFRLERSGFSVQNVGSDPALATTQCFALSAETMSGTPKEPGSVVAVGVLK